MSALRYDNGKIELHHIHPEVWQKILKDCLTGPSWVHKDRHLINHLNTDMDLWFYKRIGVLTPNEEQLTLACPVLSFGSIKYETLNYAKGMKYSRVLNSFRRHLLAIVSGEELDSESKLPHLGHACCNQLFAYTYQTLGYNGGEFDDRPSLSPKPSQTDDNENKTLVFGKDFEEGIEAAPKADDTIDKVIEEYNKLMTKHIQEHAQHLKKDDRENLEDQRQIRKER